jgi:hypothetical protein
MSTQKGRFMKEKAKGDTLTTQISPLAGTERAFFEDRREELRAGYEANIQKMVELWEASAAPVAALARKRLKRVSFKTFFGTIELWCREGVAKDGSWICPAVEHLGLRANQRYSPDMERRMAVLTTETLSYEKASGAGEDAAWMTFSDGAAHANVMRLGQIAQKTQPEATCAGAAGPEDTLIVMADGWNARHRGKNWGKRKANRKLAERIHWHEIRSAVIFKLSALLNVSGKRKAIMEKHVVSVPAETTPHHFGVLLHREAKRMGLQRAKHVFFVMDGGVWLWNIYKDRFEKCSKAMLDFYHLSQHLHELSDALHGAGSAKALAWCARILHDLKHKSPRHLFKKLDELLKEPPSRNTATLKTIRKQNAYFRKHAKHMEYAANAEMGVPIGSGSVESLCSQFQNRLKRTGQFWSKKGFANLLHIIVRKWNGELDSLWQAAA